MGGIKAFLTRSFEPLNPRHNTIMHMVGITARRMAVMCVFGLGVPFTLMCLYALALLMF